MDTLRIALERVDFLPAARVTDDTSILTLKALVFEPLLRWEDGAARPGLFSSWTHSPDARDWTFTIRPGATFHDGVPAAPGHVLDFIAGILGSTDMFGMKWSYARYFEGVALAAGPGNTVTLRAPQPFADVLDIFSEFYICREDAGGRPVLGTGPWRVAAFAPGAAAVLERLGEGAPARIEATALPQAEARLAALREGAADAALNLERLERQEAARGLVWCDALNTLSVMFYLNGAQGLFASPEARLAANLAVDRAALVAQVMDGLAAPAATVVSPFHLGFAEAGIAPLPHDPDAARRLLDRAGGAGRVHLRTPLYMPERAPEISAFVAEALGRVGIAVEVETVADRPEYAREVGRKQIGDMAIFDSSPHSTFRVLDDKISSQTRAVWWQGVADPAADALIAAARAQPPGPGRALAYGACLRHLAAAPPWLYLLHPVERAGLRAGIGGISLDHKGVLRIA
jgi:peptide/nickel transport system substrate-binding protein